MRPAYSIAVRKGPYFNRMVYVHHDSVLPDVDALHLPQ
jgi:hypothetical protein